jgi:cell wall-associated NlpC family hydrolase
MATTAENGPKAVLVAAENELILDEAIVTTENELIQSPAVETAENDFQQYQAYVLADQAVFQRAAYDPAEKPVFQKATYDPAESPVFQRASYQAGPSDPLQYESYDSVEKGALEDQVLPRASSRKPDLIDIAICARGLEGRLTTGLVGQYMLEKKGLVKAQADYDYVSSSADVSQAPSSTKSIRSKVNLTKDLLVAAYGQSGRPFKSGGRNPQVGFDGPGLVNWVYAQNGINLPQSARELVAKGQAVNKENLRPGDIVAYQDPKSSDYLVGIYSGNGNFILASSKFKVVTETAAFGTDFGPYFLGGRRYFDDPLAMPLNEDLKTAVANGAVKTALMNLGENLPKPANIYGSVTKKQKTSKGKTSASKRKAKKRS